MANDIAPLKLDQANGRLCELEAGTDCIDPQFVEPDPNVAIAQSAATAAQATANANSTDIATIQAEQLTQDTDIGDLQAADAAQDAEIAANTAVRHDEVTLGVGSDPALDLTDQVLTLDLNTAIAAYLDRAFIADDTPAINTAANVFVPYVTLNFTAAHSTDYRIAISYIWSNDAVANDFRGQLLLDGTPLWEHRQEPQDSAGADGGTGSGTDQRYLASYEEIVNLTSGPHTLVFQFASSGVGVEAAVYQADLTVERFLL